MAVRRYERAAADTPRVSPCLAGVVTAAGTIFLYALEFALGAWSMSDPIWVVLSLGAYNVCSSAVFAILVAQQMAPRKRADDINAPHAPWRR